MTTIANPLLETALTCEFLDSSGSIIYPYEISFTSKSSAMPPHATIVKIMCEISTALSSVKGDKAAVDTRNTLRFSLENNPPLTFKFNAKVAGLPTSVAWFEIVGAVMEIVSRSVTDSDLKNLASPPVAKRKSAGFSPAAFSPAKSPAQPSSQTAPHASNGGTNAGSLSGNTVKSPVPCKLPSLNDVMKFLRTNRQSVAYVPYKNTSELLPAVISSYPANPDENIVNCKLGLWRGASEVTCRISEIVLLKEVPLHARMKAYANPPASMPGLGSDELPNARITEFLGIVEITSSTSGRSTERLKVRYVCPVSQSASDAESRDDEVPLFRCTLLREGVVSEILQKRISQDKNAERRKSVGDNYEAKMADKISDSEPHKGRGSRASKRGVSDAIEVADEAPYERRKSLRFSNVDDTFEAAARDNGGMECDAESEDDLPLKENANASLKLSTNLDTLSTAVNSAPRPSAASNSVAKRRRASLGSSRLLQASPTSSVSSGRASQPPRSDVVGTGRKGVKKSTATASLDTMKMKPIANLFQGEIFMVLNAGDKSESSVDDDSVNVDYIGHIIRQSGGRVVEMPIHGMSSDVPKSAKVTVICKREVSSLKYLYAIAAGMPCVSYDWVNACLDTQSIVDKAAFLLPAGKDEGGNVYHQRAAYTRIFNSTKIFIAARCIEFFSTWKSLLEAAGAVVLPSANSNERYRPFGSDGGNTDIDEEAVNKEASTLIPTSSYVLVEPDPGCAPSRVIIDAALVNKIPLVTCKWLIRCFMNGRVVLPSEDAASYVWWGSQKSRDSTKDDDRSNH